MCGGLFELLQADIELTTLHAQALHGGGDGRGQPGCGLGAGARQLAGFGTQGGLRLLFGMLQGHQIGGRIQPVQLLFPACQQGRQFGRAALVAPCQRHPLAHAFVEFGQALRVKFGLAQVGVQAVGGVLRLCQGTGQHLGERLEFGLHMGLLGQRRLCRREPAQHALVVIVQVVGGKLRGIQQGLRVGQPGVLGVELFPFVGGRGQLVELANLPGQPFSLALQRVLRGPRFLQGLLGRAPGLP